MEIDPSPDPRDLLISSLMSLLLTYKSTCDAYELELETQLHELTLTSVSLQQRLSESEQRYEELRVRSTQNLACFYFQGQERVIRHLQGEWSSAVLQLSMCRGERILLEQILEKVAVNRAVCDRKAGKRVRVEYGEAVRKYWKDNEMGLRG